MKFETERNPKATLKTKLNRKNALFANVIWKRETIFKKKMLKKGNLKQQSTKKETGTFTISSQFSLPITP